MLPISLLSIKSEELEQGVEGGDKEEEAWRGADEDADAVGDGGLGEVSTRGVWGAPQESATKNKICSTVIMFIFYTFLWTNFAPLYDCLLVLMKHWYQCYCESEHL